MKTTNLLMSLAVGGVLLSAGCMGSAYRLASANDSRSLDIIERELPWTGDNLVVDIPAVVRYAQAPGPGRLVARGPHRSISTLRISDGRVHDGLLRTGAMIEITLMAPDVTFFSLDGRSRLTIEAYDKRHLSIATQGMAAVEAAGSAQSVAVTMQGGSVVNLARLASADLDASVGGSGTLVARPSRNAKLDVRNFGSALLLARPDRLVPALSDAGRVIDVSAPES